MKYRADIDGLRAVAIIPVVLFHANVPGFAGGFVGVDVFFVISGYLITGLIVEGLEKGSFSLRSFWERRARRLLPALFTVVFCSMLAAIPLLLLNHRHEFASSVIATIFYVSNFYFWQVVGSGYFAQPAHFHPLLHTWSLAVEEQFYIVLPLTLLVIQRWLPGRLAHWLAPAFVLAFALAWWGTLHHPTAAFYLLPTRAWELLLGGLIAVGVVPRLRVAALRELLAPVGLGMIGWAVLTYSHTTIFPGPGAILPCLGAALIIHGGQDDQTLTHRLLALPPLVGIGLLSYALYLWHWPIIVFVSYWHVDPLPPLWTTAALALALALSYLTWKHVERPWRDRRIITRPRTVAVGAVSASAVALAASLAILLVDPSTGRSPWAGAAPANRIEAVAVFSSAVDDINPDRQACHAHDALPIPPERKCVYGVPGEPPSVAVWGDSYGAEIGHALGAAAIENNAAVLVSSFSACPPVTGLFGRARPVCTEHNAVLLDYLGTHRTIRTVVLVQRYLAPDYPDLQRLLDDLEATVTALRQHGKEVVIVGPIPEPTRHVPFATARSLDGAASERTQLSRPRAVFDAETAAVRSWTERLGALDGVFVVYPHEPLCDARQCALARDGRALYFDDNHLTLSTWRQLMPLFEQALGWRMPPATSRLLKPRRTTAGRA